jgi:hypothetical protein
MKPERRLSIVALLGTPYASSPRRFFFVIAFIATILVLGAFGALP